MHIKRFFIYSFLFFICIGGNAQITKIKVHPDAGVIRSLSFINQDTGVITAYIDTNNMAGPEAFYVLYTFDGGNTWSTASNHVSYPYFLSNVQLFDNGRGYSGGQDGGIIRTGDFGRNWIYGGHVGSGTNDFEDIGFFNDSTFLVYRFHGSIYRTDDYGMNWTNFYLGYCTFAFGMKSNPFEIINDSTAFIALNGIYKTDDFGISFMQMPVDTTGLLRSICMIDTLRGLAAGENGLIYKTLDGWSSNQYITSNISSYDLYDIQFLNDSCGIAIGGKESGYVEPMYWDTIGVMYTTIDAGISWQEHIIGDASLMELQVIGEKVYIVSSDGFFYVIENVFSLGDEDIIPLPKHLITVHPNPSDGIINIDYGENIDEVKYELIDQQGRQIIRGFLNGYNSSIDCTNLKSGIYFLVVDINGTRQCKKVIIN